MPLLFYLAMLFVYFHFLVLSGTFALQFSGQFPVPELFLGVSRGAYGPVRQIPFPSLWALRLWPGDLSGQRFIQCTF